MPPILFAADCLMAEMSVERMKSQSFCRASSGEFVSSGTASTLAFVNSAISPSRSCPVSTVLSVRLLIATTPTRITPARFGPMAAPAPAVGSAAPGCRPAPAAASSPSALLRADCAARIMADMS
jgi:hypothetical protein